MSKPIDRLVAVDGVNGNAMLTVAKALVPGRKQRRGGISSWDASGIFGEIVVAEESAGLPSARTLLLLYAADLAFRLRWEINPALAEGLTVVAIPYVDTAIAFGRAAGLDPAWLDDMFNFAPRPGRCELVKAAAANAVSERQGFVEFGCRQIAATHGGHPRRLLVRRTGAHLRMIGKRRKNR